MPTAAVNADPTPWSLTIPGREPVPFASYNRAEWGLFFARVERQRNTFTTAAMQARELPAAEAEAARAKGFLTLIDESDLLVSAGSEAWLKRTYQGRLMFFTEGICIADPARDRGRVRDELLNITPAEFDAIDIGPAVE